mmetsp:Transcript_22184/g.28490  ORF Transcript_22184/g.28490 Transcript_22184/m.28490 type:complete len:86 (-) Transcript_22184:52-309(-)
MLLLRGKGKPNASLSLMFQCLRPSSSGNNILLEGMFVVAFRSIFPLLRRKSSSNTLYSDLQYLLLLVVWWWYLLVVLGMLVTCLV